MFIYNAQHKDIEHQHTKKSVPPPNEFKKTLCIRFLAVSDIARILIHKVFLNSLGNVHFFGVLMLYIFMSRIIYKHDC